MPETVEVEITKSEFDEGKRVWDGLTHHARVKKLEEVGLPELWAFRDFSFGDIYTHMINPEEKKRFHQLILNIVPTELNDNRNVRRPESE